MIRRLAKSNGVIIASLLSISTHAVAVEFGTPTWPPPGADPKLVAEIRKMQWWTACIAWGSATRKSSDTPRTKLLLSYLVSDRMIGPKDIGHVNDRTLEIGMTECGMFAAKGMAEQANHTTTAAGTSTQYVYPGMRYFVYTEPSPEYSVGVIHAIQH